MKYKDKKYTVDFDKVKGEIEYHSSENLTFTITEQNGEKVNVSESVDIHLTELRNNLLMASWTEKSGKTIVQIQDFENQIIYSNVTLPNGTLVNLKGTLKLK